jgi:hypothetical protein
VKISDANFAVWPLAGTLTVACVTNIPSVPKRLNVVATADDDVFTSAKPVLDNSVWERTLGKFSLDWASAETLNMVNKIQRNENCRKRNINLFEVPLIS